MTEAKPTETAPARPDQGLGQATQAATTPCPHTCSLHLPHSDASCTLHTPCLGRPRRMHAGDGGRVPRQRPRQPRRHARATTRPAAELRAGRRTESARRQDDHDARLGSGRRERLTRTTQDAEMRRRRHDDGPDRLRQGHGHGGREQRSDDDDGNKNSTHRRPTKTRPRSDSRTAKPEKQEGCSQADSETQPRPRTAEVPAHIRPRCPRPNQQDNAAHHTNNA